MSSFFLYTITVEKELFIMYNKITKVMGIYDEDDKKSIFGCFLLFDAGFINRMQSKKQKSDYIF